VAQFEKLYTEVLYNEEFNKIQEQVLEASLRKNQLKISPFPELYFLNASLTRTHKFSKSFTTDGFAQQ
jgi:hypothetical protein